MRTTVTLDEDVVRLLRAAMRRSRRGFKETLNAAVRAGLTRTCADAQRAAFVVKARPMGLRRLFESASFNKPVDEFEVDAFLAKSRKPKRE